MSDIIILSLAMAVLMLGVAGLCASFLVLQTPAITSQGTGFIGATLAALALGLLLSGLITLGLYELHVGGVGWWKAETMGMRYGRAVGVLRGLLPSAQAHSWYPQECCGGSDCHPVPCDELAETEKGVKWKQFTFTSKQIRATQDKECHVCVHENEYGGRGYCVFVQPTG